jgi:molybdenum cofactor sulfurtransferase
VNPKDLGVKYNLLTLQQLPAKSMIDAFANDVNSTLYGNPHSTSTPSHLAGVRIDDTRTKTLKFFNANPEDFDLVFVANASAAIKLVTECFRDAASQNKKSSQRNFWYGYHRDSHNSVVGGRELAGGNHCCFSDDDQVDKWINDKKSKPSCNQLGLFAYPGQSNMTGRRLPLSIPNRIRVSHRGQNTYTLLDAAALATTTQLDLDEIQPDFTAISFYRIFGFPNLGALIVRKAAGHTLLKRRYFGGGTVDLVTVIKGYPTVVLKSDDALHNRLEDGTLPFHSIFALDHAISVHRQLFTSMARISAHTSFLGKYLYDSMIALKHSNGAPLFQIYKEQDSTFGDAKTQGSTIAFNIFGSNGERVGYGDVENHANERGIFVRSGSLCNPGGVATYLNWTAQELHEAYAQGHRCSSPKQSMTGKATGVVRISLGAMSTKEDVDKFLGYAEECYLNVEVQNDPSVVYTERQFAASSLFSRKKTSKATAAGSRWSRAKDSLGKFKRGHSAVAVTSV